MRLHGRCAGFVVFALPKVPNPAPLAVQRRHDTVIEGQKHKRVSGHYANNPCQSLVPVNGIELLTFALRMRCSTN